jgi:hypothetical protein
MSDGPQDNRAMSPDEKNDPPGIQKDLVHTLGTNAVGYSPVTKGARRASCALEKWGTQPKRISVESNLDDAHAPVRFCPYRSFHTGLAWTGPPAPGTSPSRFPPHPLSPPPHHLTICDAEPLFHLRPQPTTDC